MTQEKDTSDGDCHASAGAYLPFPISYYRHGLSDCGGGSGPWKRADCLPNVVIRYARARKCLEHLQKLAGCYWMERDGCPEHCYIEGTFKLDFYLTRVKNSDRGLSHAVCAEFRGGDMQTFSSWKFYQYANLDIKPGDWQMPYGTETEATMVQIYEIIGITTCALPDYVPESPKAVFLIDEYGTVTPEEEE
jgi:hypothetical protein